MKIKSLAESEFDSRERLAGIIIGPAISPWRCSFAHAIKKGWKLEKGARFHALFLAKKLRRYFFLAHPDILIAYGIF
jgi:hypothetical protein